MLKLSTWPPEEIIQKPNLAEKCKVCGDSATVFDVVDFNKFCEPNGDFYSLGMAGVPIYYFRCECCHLIFSTAFDVWTDSEFSQYIYNSEYIRVDGEYTEARPTSIAMQIKQLFGDNIDASILDYGAGSGAMAAKLRQMGFKDVNTYDRFSDPSRPTRKFDFVVSTEVVEHSTDPLGIFADMRSLVVDTGAILFQTALQPPDISKIKANWWYIAPRNGHVTFYNHKSLCILAEKMGFRYFPGHFHCFKGSTASQVTRKVTSQMGIPLTCRRLCAPPASSPTPDWQGVERNSFRWSKSKELTWPLTDIELPARVLVELPFINEIQPGFAAAVRFKVGTLEIQPQLEKCGDHRRLTAVLDFTQGADSAVKVITPVPAKPSDLGHAADNRDLGLAVLMR